MVEAADNPFAQWFEKLWSTREETVYPALFGDLGGGIYTANAATYQRFSKEPHPGWLNHGVFGSPPSEARSSWLYVTSGISNPWNLQAPGRDPTGFSGLGFELVIETPEPAPWAVALLHNLMAYELLVATGQYEGAELLEYGNRVPLNDSITSEFDSPVRWLLVTQPKHYDQAFELESGRVDLYHLVGATDAEVEFARAHGQDELLTQLEQKGIAPRTDPRRESLC
ncbi:MAG: suppressor of fused domain protein [Planctomycetes bacterium]|nr:suppressor of fused domain protein [Planctomycetota bacterium]